MDKVDHLPAVYTVLSSCPYSPSDSTACQFVSFSWECLSALFLVFLVFLLYTVSETAPTSEVRLVDNLRLRLCVHIFQHYMFLMNVGRGGVKTCWLSYCQWLFDYPNHRLSTIHLFLSLSWSIINVLHWSIIMYQDLYLIWGTVASIHSHWFKIFTVITSKLPCEEQIYSMNDYMYLQMAYCKIMHCILTKLDLKSWYHACITEFEGWYAKT